MDSAANRPPVRTPIYADSRGQRYTVRPTDSGYRLSWISGRSGKWYELPGFPAYADIVSAEKDLQLLAEAVGMTASGEILGDVILWR